MATIRTTAISLLRLTARKNAAALRHHAAQPDKIITMLNTTNGTLP